MHSVYILGPEKTVVARTHCISSELRNGTVSVPSEGNSYIVVLLLCTIITTDSKLVDSVGYFTYSSISCIGVSSSPIQ